MDLWSKLVLGSHVATAWPNLLAVLAGATLGTLVGMLPRMGPMMAIALLLPVVPALDTTPALILLASVCPGARYGAGVASDGPVGGRFAMAMLASFLAGCAGVLVLALLALPLAAQSFSFGAAENFALLVLGLVASVVLASGSLIKALAMGVLGLLLGQLGRDASTGSPRFLLELPQLSAGVNFIALAVGLFACGELIAQLARHPAVDQSPETPDPVAGPRPTRQDLKDAWPAMLKGTALGAVLGLLPGRGAHLASFAACAWEDKAARDDATGEGRAIQRVAARESAIGAAVRVGFVPTLSLGVPPNALMALLVGAMALKGIQAGPQVMTGRSDLFWGLIVSMWIGNLALLVLNLPRLAFRPQRWRVSLVWLSPILLLASCFGVYIAGTGSFNVYLMAFVTAMAYLFHKLDCEPSALMLGFVLGPMMESSLRHALSLSGGDWGVFINRPLSAGLLAAALLAMLVLLLPRARKLRAAAFKGDDRV